MNKKIAYKILFFFFLIVLIDQLTGRWIAHYALKYNYDKRIGLLIDNELKKDVIILGSSRALNGIDPATIEKETNLSCYNLAFSGSNVSFHETILDLIIQSKHHPKIIIYNIDDPGTLQGFGDQLIYRTEELFPYVYNSYVNEIVAKRLGKTVFITKLSPTYHHNINFVNALKYILRGSEKPSYEINNIDNYGANLMDGYQIGKENISYQKTPPYQFNNELPVNTTSFVNIINKCKKSGVNLIMVFPPTFYSSTPGFRERISVLTKNKCVVLDYAQEFKENSFFYNHGHLNKKGAVKFSLLISQYLKEH